MSVFPPKVGPTWPTSARPPSRELRPLTREWLSMLPPILVDDVWIQSILNALANEVERMISMATAVAEGLNPLTANEYTIAIWEQVVGITPIQGDVPLDVRRQNVIARLTRSDGSGAAWEAAMSRATGASYRYAEGGYDVSFRGTPVPPYWVRMVTALVAGQTIESLRAYVRQITPANLHLEILGGQTYEDLKAAQPTYQAARDAYRNYDNMRYGVVKP